MAEEKEIISGQSLQNRIEMTRSHRARQAVLRDRVERMRSEERRLIAIYSVKIALPRLILMAAEEGENILLIQLPGGELNSMDLAKRLGPELPKGIQASWSNPKRGELGWPRLEHDFNPPKDQKIDDFSGVYITWTNEVSIEV
jgi:hypothetical protein